MRMVRMQSGGQAPKSWGKRLGWLVLIWALSVLALGLVAYGFRWVMALAGLSLA